MVYVHVGHSLGGVMAVLAAYDLADLFPWLSLRVYTVGAPRPAMMHTLTAPCHAVFTTYSPAAVALAW